jgi:hypothetical protein
MRAKGCGITSVIGSDPAPLLLRAKHLIARAMLLILCSGYNSGISQTHSPFRQVQKPGFLDGPHLPIGQRVPQFPQVALLDKSLSQPLLRSLSQLAKPSMQAKSHVPVLHDRIVFSGATQALSQQTRSTQNPERHWFGVAAEQAVPFGCLGWHSPPLHQ